MSNSFEKSYSSGEKNALLGILSNVFLFIIKFLAGIFGHSQAMVADAFHTASDVLTSVFVVIGFKIARKPPDEHHPFGHGRAESISAKLVSLILIAIGVKIAFTSAKLLITGDLGEPGSIALVAAVISIIIKEITYLKVIKVSNQIKSSSLHADALHHRSDVLSSIAALIGIAGAKMGKPFMDPLAGIIVAGFIIKMGVDTFHQAYDELMDAAPSVDIKNEIERITKQVDGVEEVKKIMARKTGIELFLEVTVGVKGTKTVEEGHVVTIKIKRDIFRKMQNVRDVVVHVEPV